MGSCRRAFGVFSDFEGLKSGTSILSEGRGLPIPRAGCNQRNHTFEIDLVSTVDDFGPAPLGVYQHGRAVFGNRLISLEKEVAASSSKTGSSRAEHRANDRKAGCSLPPCRLCCAYTSSAGHQAGTAEAVKPSRLGVPGTFEKSTRVGPRR